MLPLFAGILILAAAMMLTRWFATTPLAEVLRAAKWTAAALLVGSGVFLLMSGRLAWALAAVLGLVPGILRTLHAHRLNQGRAEAGGASSVKTRFLDMQLEHATGRLTGEVLEGPYRGRKLTELSFDEALDLHRQCAADAASAQVLEAWLDRTWVDWRAHPQTSAEAPPPPENAAAMSRAEAFAVLGLQPEASPAEVKAAYRRLMSLLHPDHGGSDYLAAKINQAKKLLIGD